MIFIVNNAIITMKNYNYYNKISIRIIIIKKLIMYYVLNDQIARMARLVNIYYDISSALATLGTTNTLDNDL